MPIKITFTDKADLERQIKEAIEAHRAAGRARAIACDDERNASELLCELIELLEAQSVSVLDEARQYARRFHSVNKDAMGLSLAQNFAAYGSLNSSTAKQ